MSGGCPALVIGATGSSVGKTSVALSLIAALAARGLRVQPFKVGPDFLDPTYLGLAAGRPCYNLDGWMTDRDYVQRLFRRAAADADIAVIEGVMGLFDGASPTGVEGSTAEVARWLDAPVVLVASVHGVARSLAATVHGFATFEPTVAVVGVVGNQAGTSRHRAALAAALTAAGGPPLLGAIPREAMPSLPSRHLGLVTADADRLSPAVLAQFAEVGAAHLDLDRIVALARRAGTSGDGLARDAGAARPDGERRVRLGVAWDRAFHFYYPDNLEALEAHGAECIRFSPMADAALPAGLDALYLGGGYPEVHAPALSANRAMRAAVAAFAAAGRPVYAECGGLMYLGRSLRTLDGVSWPMAGVIPIDTAMRERVRTLGYVEVKPLTDACFGAPRATLRGHEFHYSEIVADDARASGWGAAYEVRRRRGGTEETEGFQHANVLASYVHLHFAAHSEVLRGFLRTAAASRRRPIAEDASCLSPESSAPASSS